MGRFTLRRASELNPVFPWFSSIYKFIPYVRDISNICVIFFFWPFIAFLNSGTSTLLPIPCKKKP
jgi:hypothetical protein